MQHIFNHCPNCKGGHLEYPEGNKIFCPDCGFVYYHNVAGAVAVIVQKEAKILLTERNKDPKKGFLDLAGGFVDAGESAEETCVRELREELNMAVDISKLKYLASAPNEYPYKGTLYNTIDLFFLYRDDSLEIENFDQMELKGFVWKKLSEVDIEMIAFESQKKVLALLKEKSNPE
ncbi:MAG: NUDIX domain-containing protein [Flavobacteriaceae bacterium]|jgi:NADH pyrophosphatase NudC (nudix superfamily)|nr:NUDIX domain-containing protein [Flavobacteriaceae bacterium]